MFKIGEKIIYKRDLCIVKDIINIHSKKYYKLIPVSDNTLTINVPTDNKEKNLRYPITKKEAEKLIKKIPDINAITTNDKLLEQVYKKLMKTNKHEDLIKIIKTTYLRNEERRNNGKKETDKDLSFFKQAEEYLYNELSISLNMNYEECKKYIIKEVINEEKSNAK